MKKERIEHLFDKDENHKIEIYLSILLAKCKDIDKENNFIGIGIIFLVALFYLGDFVKTESLQVGPISINDINSIKTFLPLVLAFFIFRFNVINFHKLELHKLLKKITKDYFKIEANYDLLEMDDFTRSILPTSMNLELANLSRKKGKSKFGCFGSILMVPIFAIWTIPLLLEYLWIKEFLTVFHTLNIIEKSSIILSIWIIIVSIYYFMHSVIIRTKEDD